MIKKDTIVVRTRNGGNANTRVNYPGFIFKVERDSSYGYAAIPGNGGDISYANYRLATSQEISFYNSGGTDINKMKKETFSLYF